MSLTTLAKSSILEVSQCSEYVSDATAKTRQEDKKYALKDNVSDLDKKSSLT